MICFKWRVLAANSRLPQYSPGIRTTFLYMGIVDKTAPDNACHTVTAIWVLTVTQKIIDDDMVLEAGQTHQI